MSCEAAGTDSVARLPAVVTAGAPSGPEFGARYSVEYLAAVPVFGKMMLQHVVDALRASSHVGDIYVVGNFHPDSPVEMVPPRGSFFDNLLAGLEACGSRDGRVLVANSDMPMLTAEAIDDFVQRCGDLKADFYYSVVSKEASEKRFPGMRRTYGWLAEGTFTGGNVVVLNPELVRRNAGTIREVLQARKNIWSLARLFGFGIILRALVARVLWPGALSLKYLEAAIGRILGAAVRAVQTPYAEIGADIDHIEDIEIVERLRSLEGESK